MLDLIHWLVRTIVQVLRRIWQKITGRVPVPVRVPVRRRAHTRPFSSSRWPLNDFRGSRGETRRRPW